jgi:hypothetical protein
MLISRRVKEWLWANASDRACLVTHRIDHLNRIRFSRMRHCSGVRSIVNALFALILATTRNQTGQRVAGQGRPVAAQRAA